MSDMEPGGETADQAEVTDDVSEVWSQLAADLAAQMQRMIEGDYLIAELPVGRDGGTTPYAQFAGFDAGMLRAELAGDAYVAPAYTLSAEWCETLRLIGWQGNDADERNWFVERPVGDSKIMAAMVVGALRETYGVVHPHLLTYRAWGPTAEAAADLGLHATADVPAELPVSPEVPMVLVPDDRDDLVEMAVMSLHVKYGDRPSVDDDGDVVLSHLGQPVWVRVGADQPSVEIFARVAHGVHSRRATATELAVLNRDHQWAKWVLRDRDVWQHLTIPGAPFVPAHLDVMVDVFLETMSATRDDLAFRVGGRVA